MKLSKNFDLSEFTHSVKATQLGINNAICNQYVIDNIKMLVNAVLQPLRTYIDAPVIINSGYRCLELNKAVGGVPTSQHCTGNACDFRIDGMNSFEIATAILRLDLPFDQLILYPNFVHVSYSERDRRTVLYSKDYDGDKVTLY